MKEQISRIDQISFISAIIGYLIHVLVKGQIIVFNFHVSISISRPPLARTDFFMFRLDIKLYNKKH